MLEEIPACCYYTYVPFIFEKFGISMSFGHSKEQKGVKHAVQGERKRSSDQSSTVAR